MKKKLNLDVNLIQRARFLAKNISNEIHHNLQIYSTTSTERAICRLLGVDGMKDGVPYPNALVNYLQQHNLLEHGVASAIATLVHHWRTSPQRGVERLLKQGYFPAFLITDPDKILLELEPWINESRYKIRQTAARHKFVDFPLIYVIVATGDIREDIIQAKAAARQGADVIATIRSTAQSLLDYVPYGETREGIGGTFATQKNFQLMRAALDEVGTELGRYIYQCNYCSGLCMPEIAAMGALEGLDVMLNDALYGILFRDINPIRTLVDQQFSRRLNGKAGIIINTGEDNYLTTMDAIMGAPVVLASQFLNEAMALQAGVPEKQQGLGHAFEISPEVENGFLYEVAQAQLTREIFPDSPLKYMPPTKHITGNIFQAQVQDTLFNVASILTQQSIHLLGIPTEAIHTPFLADRFISLENYCYVARTMKTLSDEICFAPNGIIQRRAQDVLSQAIQILEEISQIGLLDAIQKGIFAGIKRSPSKGRGLDGVFVKSNRYINPFGE